jgi:alpha-D-ribose 1-methylphosphonate 5-triphosphate synthase subunit PhnH
MSEKNEVFERDEALDAQAFALQSTFRVLLDCMARPGEVGRLEATPTMTADAKRAGVLPATLMLADVLLDAGTTAHVAAPADPACARTIARRTHVALAAADTAAYAIVPEAVRGDDAAALVAALTPGTLEDPHRGATCIVECATLLGLDAEGERIGSVSSVHDRSCWELSGPGIKTTSRLELDRGEAVRAREERGDEFPCGIDLVFVDGAGHVAAVPRSTSVKEVAAWDM